MTVHDIPSIVKVALSLELNSNNIINGFRKAGIVPFNKNIFEESDFLSAFVTDRLLIEEEIQQNLENIPEMSILNLHKVHTRISTVDINSAAFSSEIILPFPKAAPRNKTITRRTRKTAILTDTPEKNALEEEQNKKSKNKGSRKDKGKKILKTKFLKDFKEKCIYLYFTDSNYYLSVINITII